MYQNAIYGVVCEILVLRRFSKLKSYLSTLYAAVEGDSVEIEERHIKSEKTKLLNDDRVNRWFRLVTLTVMMCSPELSSVVDAVQRVYVVLSSHLFQRLQHLVYVVLWERPLLPRLPVSVWNAPDGRPRRSGHLRSADHILPGLRPRRRVPVPLSGSRVPSWKRRRG